MKTLAITAVLMCSLAGCADDDGPSGPVLLTGTDRYITDTGEQQVAVDPSDVSVFTIDANGESVELAVRDTGAGLEVADAPGGIYYIQRGQLIVATDARTVDVGTVMLGRVDATAPSESTPLDLQLSDLAAWQDGDAVHLYSAGAGLWSPYIAMPEPAGDPTVGALSLDFDALSLPLVDSGAGDALHVTQFRVQSIGAHSYQSALRSQAVSVDMTTADASIATALVAPPQQTLAIDWPVAAYDDARQDVQPIAITAFYDFYLAAIPEGASHGHFGASADLISMRAQDLGERLLGSMSYADPFPSAWTRVATTVAWYPVTYTLPGASRVTLWDGMWNRAGWAGGAVDMSPVLGPPVDVSQNWNGGLCVSWSAPVSGSASSYQLTFYNLFDEGGVSRLSPAVGARTTDTRFCLAEDFIDRSAGGVVVQVGAVFSIDNSALPAPFGTSLPHGFAETSALAPPRPR